MFCDQVSNLSSSSMSASPLNKSVWLSPMAAKKDCRMKDKSKSYNNPKSIAILYMQHADLAVQFWWVYFCLFRLKPADLPGPFLFQQTLSPQILAGEICRFCFPPGTSAGFGWNLQKSRPDFWKGTSARSILEANELICGGFGSRQGRFLRISFEPADLWTIIHGNLICPLSKARKTITLTEFQSWKWNLFRHKPIESATSLPKADPHKFENPLSNGSHKDKVPKRNLPPSPPGAFYLAFYLANLLAFYLAFNLANILALYLIYHLAFYLAYLLAFYLAYLPAFYLAYLLAFYLTCYLAFYLAYLLAFYLAVEVQRCSLSSEGPRLRSSSAHWARRVPGWGPAVLTELGRSQVEVQRCSLNSAGPRLRSSGAHWARQVPGRGPAVPTTCGSWRRGRKWTWEWRQRWWRRRRRTRRRRKSRRRRRRTTLITSNNPHLAGGENMYTHVYLYIYKSMCIYI